MSLRPRLVAFSCPVLVRLATRRLREWAPKRKKRRKRPETVFGLYRVIALSSVSSLPYLGLYFPLRGTFMFNICCVCIQYESFNNFENDTNNESVNEIKSTGFWSRNRAAIQQNFLPGPQSYRDCRETKLRSCLTLSLFMACLVLRCSFYYFPILSCIYMPQLVFACLVLSCLVIFDRQSYFKSFHCMSCFALLVLLFSCRILYVHASACICMYALSCPASLFLIVSLEF